MDNHGNAPYARVRFLEAGRSLPDGDRRSLADDLASWQKAVIDASEGDPADTADHYRTLMELAESGALRPVIDSVRPFAQIVDAYRRVDGGHKVGSVVLTFS